MSRRSDFRALQLKVMAGMLDFIETMQRDEIAPSATWHGLAPVDTSYANFLGLTRSRQVLGFRRLQAWDLPGVTVNSNVPEPLKIMEDSSLLIAEERASVQKYLRVEIFDSKHLPEPLLREISLGLDNWAQSSQ